VLGWQRAACRSSKLKRGDLSWVR